MSLTWEVISRTRLPPLLSNFLPVSGLPKTQTSPIQNFSSHKVKTQLEVLELYGIRIGSEGLDLCHKEPAKGKKCP